MTRKVVVLGAGLVSGPALEYFAADTSLDVTVVVKEDLKKAIKICSRFASLELDITQESEKRDKLISEADIVVGIVPHYILYEVAKVCLKHRKHLVTASYVSPEVQSLHESAVSEDVTFLCEMGLDPGIDHMLAMKHFDDIREKGGEVTSYELWCGGFPAPDNANNPLKYKFSWNPRAALGSCTRGGSILKNCEMIDIPEGGTSLLEWAEDVRFKSDFDLEGFPNILRSSYFKLYNIQTAKNVVRGTLRYKGFSNAVKGLIKVGLFEEETHPLLKAGAPDITWKTLIGRLVGHTTDLDDDSLRGLVLEKVDGDQQKVDAIAGLGLLENTPVDKQGSPLETLSAYLATRLVYEPNQRDLVVMHLEIGGQYQDNSEEKRKVDLVVYGDSGGYTAMAKTVGYTVAIATKMILDGKIKARGVVLPVSSDIYMPVLSALKEQGVEAKENVITK